MEIKIINVAGMHRSGTSLLGNWLSDSGINMGDELLDENFSNQKGHFEDKKILEIFKKDLQGKGFNKSGLAINSSKMRLSDPSRNELQSYIYERNIKYNVWGWKEPRSTLYLNELKEIIPDLKVIGLYREPADVIYSLINRMLTNRWYYYLYDADNKFEKLKSRIRIKFEKKRWIRKYIQAYIFYNKNLLEFKQLYPKDIILFSHADFVNNGNVVVNACNNFICLPNKLISTQEVYDKRLITQKRSEKYLFEFSEYEEAINVYSELESLNDIKRIK